MRSNAKNGKLKNKKTVFSAFESFKNVYKEFLLKHFLESLSIIDEFNRSYYYFFIDTILNVFLTIRNYSK